MNNQQSFIVVFVCHNPAINKLSYINIEFENYNNELPSNCSKDIEDLCSIFNTQCATERIAYGKAVDVCEVVIPGGSLLFNELCDYENPMCH